MSRLRSDPSSLWLRRAVRRRRSLLVMAFLGSVGVGLCLIASLGKLFVEGLDRFLPLPEQIVDEGLFVRVKAIQSCGRETAMVVSRIFRTLV